MKLTKNARTVLEKRYLLRDSNGKVIEEPEDLFARVAKDIARADYNYGASDEEVSIIEDEFYKLMVRLDFLPNSPTLFNAGRPLQLLSACFVLPIEDSLESIFQTMQDMVMVQRTGGGTGFSFSRLRPKGDIVTKTMREASGPVSFMKAYDASTGVIKQGGMRRGANMGILRVDHPDIRDFIHCKDRENQHLTNFNISVAITDKFMRYLDEDEAFPLVNPRTDEVTDWVDPKTLWNLIVNHAWLTGDPGLWFIDRTNQFEPANDLIEATNPCGEQPLLPYESCVLGSINVSNFVREGELNFDWNRLRNVVRWGVHFLDNVIDRNKYPIAEIEKMSREYRRIGLGIMGWADALVKLKMPYDSEAAIDLAGTLMKFISANAFEMSLDLAKQRGPFPGWKKTSYKGRKPPRNIARTTIAPTGTLSRIAGCSSGIEPYFALAYESHILDGQVLIDKVELLQEHLKDDPNLRPYMDAILKNKGCARGTIVSDTIQELFPTAMEIPWEVHVKMQAAFQEFTDNAVSKTINMPEDATIDDVKNAYYSAYQLGCKGITIYRDKSKDVQVLNLPQKEKAPLTRPDLLPSETEKIRTGHDNLYITITHREEEPFEVFCNIGKSGGEIAAYSQALGRVISLALRVGVDPVEIIQQLENISCGHHSHDHGEAIFSDPDAIAKALRRFLKRRGMEVPDNGNSLEYRLEECPQCGGRLIHEEGCDKCTSCDYTRCD